MNVYTSNIVNIYEGTSFYDTKVSAIKWNITLREP